MQALQSHLFAVREILSPVLKESKFLEHGCITPQEFVIAGDFLVYKFPTWSWEQGDKSKIRDFLPENKQYLVTRGVPCLRRATSLAYTDADEDAERLLSFADSSTPTADGDEWVETHAGRKAENPGNPGVIDDIPDLDGPNDVTNGVAGLNLNDGHHAEDVGEIPDLDDIPDMEEALEEEDEATAAPKPTAAPSSRSNVTSGSGTETIRDNLLQVRTYDVMITYDKYYQTPRVWLIGYDENRNPLTPQQIFQDISADHAHKTVTIEPFIHSTSLQAASVHPCKHASVMKKVIERMNAGIITQQMAQQKGKESTGVKKKWLFGGGGKSSSSGKKEKGAVADSEEQVGGMRVDFYLVVFLKFIASIVPTIEVDSTASF